MRDTTHVGHGDAYREHTEFLVRHRFPRPVASRLQRVVTEPTPDGLRRAVRSCARATLRFLASVQQAERRAREEVTYVVVPEPRSLRAGYPEPYFFRELAGQSASRLLALGGETGGGLPVVPDGDLSRELLLDVLADLACLADYRLLIAGPWSKPYYKGSVVLLGGGLSFFGQAVEGPDVPPGVPLLCDPRDGRLLSLAPWLCWEPGATPAEGSLLALTGLAGPQGIYDEVGSMSARRLTLPLEGTPRHARAPLLPGQTLAVRHPPGRYLDGDRFEQHYEVHGVVWRGGVTNIYRAVRLSDGEPVVLKTFEGEQESENRGRFVDELRFGLQVRHPNVIRYRQARHSAAPHVFELEYAAGGSLADRLAVAGVLDPFETLAILAQLCDALGAVHAAGIMHLDLKPENVLFTADREVRLIDFGISVTRARLDRFVRPGVLVGSPGFIPPERRAGEPVHPQADLWELGVLASEMLLGTRAQTPADIPGPPRLDEPLAAVLRRLLEPDPADRYRSAAETRQALRDAVARVRPRRCIALDLEGTLLTTAFDPLPRPGLADFAEWCLETFDRIFVYTAVQTRQAEVVLARFQRAGVVSEAFVGRCEIVDWPRGAGGSLKDLRRLGLPLGWVVLLDDMRSWVAPDQRHRWVRIRAFDEPRPGDRELEHIRPEILARFAL